MNEIILEFSHIQNNTFNKKYYFYVKSNNINMSFNTDEDLSYFSCDSYLDKPENFIILGTLILKHMEDIKNIIKTKRY